MIPHNITRELIIKAIEEVNVNGVPSERDSTKFVLKYQGKEYPPKYLISIANKYINGEELKARQFSGGEEANMFLEGLGFIIIKKDDINSYIKVRFALRDERINVFSMTKGELPFRFSHQFILCKKVPFSENRIGPFVLDAKQSEPIYQLSLTGVTYSNVISAEEYNLKYIAFVDTQLKIKISLELFSMLQDKGFFSIWDPEAPYKYFGGFEYGYLVIFRVYEVTKSIPEDLLDKGRKGRNYYFSLSQTHYCEAIAPVISDDNFENQRLELIDLLKSKGWLLEVIQSSFDIPVVVRVQQQELMDKENQAVIRNDKLSLVELADKIKVKSNNRKPVLVESKQYYRDPDVSSYAQKRANGICECCGREAPFRNQDGRLYLEVHHLIPLSQGGEDKIYNVCAVCPNCHRELHFGINKTVLKDKIIKSL